MLLSFLVLGVLALGQQVVLADSFKFSFSEVQQCEPLFISFKGELDPSDSVPATLTVLPFNATAVFIPVPSGATNTTGLNVTFLPLAEDTQFIASLDDSTSDNAAKISDIVRVESGSNSCQVQNPKSFVPSFTVEGPVSQCENFKVRYQNGVPPNIRMFSLKGGSAPLNMVENDPQTGTAQYVMVAPRQSEVLLLFNDTKATPQTSPLLTVQGDTSSSNACFPQQNNMKMNNGQQNQAPKSGVSKGVAIGLGVGFGVLVALAAPMLWYVIRERRRNQRAARNNNNTFDGAAYIEKPSYDSDEKRGYSPDPYQAHTIPSLPPKPARPPAPPPFFAYNPQLQKEGYVKDPAYVSDAYSPTVSEFSNSRSSASWEMITPGDRKSGSSIRRQSNSSSRSQRNTQTILPSSRDLEHMLDVAGENSNDSLSRNNSERFFGSNNPRGSRTLRNSGGSRRSWVSMSGNIAMPSAAAIPTRTRSRTGSYGGVRTGSASGSMTFSVSGLNPIQDVPQNVSFLANTEMDDTGEPIFYDSPRSMGSYLAPSRSSRRSYSPLENYENPGRVGSRFSAITAASDDSVGQILQVHLQQPGSRSGTSQSYNSSNGTEDGNNGPGGNSPFRFPGPPPSMYSPSPLARATMRDRQSTASMESWGNVGK